MIIHSVTPVQYLFPEPELPPTELRNIAGGMAECIQTTSGYEIRRIISTDPAMYLNPKFSPGQPLK